MITIWLLDPHHAPRLVAVESEDPPADAKRMTGPWWKPALAALKSNATYSHSAQVLAVDGERVDDFLPNTAVDACWKHGIDLHRELHKMLAPKVEST